MSVTATKPDSSKLNKRNPHELHWKIDPEEWKGNIDLAYEHYYNHLDDQVYCRHCGAIPCPVDHEDTKLAKLQDLQFVKEMAKERRELQQMCEKMFAELKEYERHKKVWDSDKMLLEAEVKRLAGLSAGQKQQLRHYRRDQQQMAVMKKKIEHLEMENENLTQDLKKYRQMLLNQTEEVNKIRRENQKLQDELERSAKIILSLKADLKEANDSKNYFEEKLSKKDAEIERLKSEINTIVIELRDKTKEFQEKDCQNHEIIDELRERINMLKQRIDDGERYQRDLLGQIAMYLREIEKLRRKLQNDSRFQKYIEVKRVVNDLKEQNESLVQKVTVEEAKKLPVMVKSGKTTTLGLRLSSGRRVKSATVRASSAYN